jgi:hypothetical protein
MEVPYSSVSLHSVRDARVMEFSSDSISLELVPVQGNSARLLIKERGHNFARLLIRKEDMGVVLLLRGP